MNHTDKCLFCVPGKKECLIIGLSNIVISIICISAITALMLDSNYVEQSAQNSTASHNNLTHNQLLSLIGLKKTSINIITITLLMFSISGIMFSALLMFGDRRGKPSLLLCYFVFGVFQAIISLLGVVLELIHLYWQVALPQLIVTVLYIQGLVVLHASYESMVRGRVNDNSPHELLDDEKEEEN